MKKAKARIKVTYAPFDVADYLDSEEAIAEYLSLAARDENPDVLLKALGDVAKARGMAEVAKASGLGRESSTRHSRRVPSRVSKRLPPSCGR